MAPNLRVAAIATDQTVCHPKGERRDKQSTVSSRVVSSMPKINGLNYFVVFACHCDWWEWQYCKAAALIESSCVQIQYIKNVWRRGGEDKTNNQTMSYNLILTLNVWAISAKIADLGAIAVDKFIYMHEYWTYDVVPYSFYELSLAHKVRTFLTSDLEVLLVLFIVKLHRSTSNNTIPYSTWGERKKPTPSIKIRRL